MGRLLVMDDVTPERKMAQTQHDFVAMIGHELRTPLTIVRGFTNLMKRRVDQATQEESLEALDTIEAKAGQLEGLIEDLLYVSKIESREATLRIDQTDIVELVRRVANDVLANHSERELNLDMPHTLKWACDEMKVGLVLRHLIDNALKYSDVPEAVAVQVTEDDDELRFDVVDRGHRDRVERHPPHLRAVPSGRRLLDEGARRHRRRPVPLLAAVAGSRRPDLGRLRMGQGLDVLVLDPPRRPAQRAREHEGPHGQEAA